KHTRSMPFVVCALSNLPGGSPLDDPLSPQNRDIPVVTPRDGPRALLNGSCYVFSPRFAAMQTRGSLRYCYMVSAEMGSLYQTQLLMEVCGTPSPIINLGSRAAILFVG